jgi:hypothetical protein
VLVEVRLEAVERPAAEGQAQGLRVGQGRGEDLGPLLLGIGMRASGTREVFQGGQAAVIEPPDPGRDGGSRDVDLVGDVVLEG